MTTSSPTRPCSPGDRLREARRQWRERGTVAEGLVAPQLLASWTRSREGGLRPEGRFAGAPHASGAQLARALEQQRCLVSQATPVLAFLTEQVRDSGNIVLLADLQGMLLCTMGDAPFAERAARVALRSGAVWSEQWRGTNAIGTALAAGADCVVRGAEHYLDRNAFLTCAAAPIFSSLGELLGVLDVSGDRRGHHPHTLGLVRAGARMVEHQLFLARHAGGLQLHLHAHAEGLGTVTEAMLALSEEGWITAANTAALELLGLSRTAIGVTPIEQILATDVRALLADAGTSAGVPRVLRRLAGGDVWARLDPGRTLRRFSVASESEATAPMRPGGDGLAALDQGDAAMHAAIERARRVLDKPIAILLQGESGVGKEVFARAIHSSGARRSGPFVAVNCAALPESLIEAELFGYRAGAFTGASREGVPGRIREAHGGMLFLDEIGDMPLALQGRLLRVLQERQVTPLGGGKAIAVDFRLLCASHRKLRDEVAQGRFREDLFYRINGLTLSLPPLRERTDLDALVRAMLAEVAPDRAMALAPEVAAAFGRYRWPGNLRQLCNVLGTACALADDEGVIDWQHLPDDLVEELDAVPEATPERADSGSDLRLQAERWVDEAVRMSNGNLSEAARRLGISRNTLYRKLQRLRAACS